jgi:hypothetical protein
MNKNERMEKLNAMGINTGKYFTVNLDNGTQIHLIIDENGNPVKVNDTIANGIIEDGYVRNTKLHRRFVMAQMFQALNYKSYYRNEEGYSAWLNNHGIKYAFDMMLEEIKVLSKLEVRDEETFIERSNFFTREVIAETMEDYIEKLASSISAQRTYKCKGIPYKKVKGRDIFVADLEKKIYAPMKWDARKVRVARNYNDIYRIVSSFQNKMITLPWTTPTSKAWKDAYKGEGAFYTLKNLVMFHNCGIEVNGNMVYGAAAVSVLNKRLNEYKGEGWRMFALMKKVIKDNDFDFGERMREIYSK